MARSMHASQGDPSPGSTKPYVVVIFGRTGVGITSLVDLIVGYPTSSANPDARPTAQRIRSHPVSLPSHSHRHSKQFLLYEVPGFGGPTPDAAILKMIQRIERDVGIDLFIHCFRSQKATVQPNIVRLIKDGEPGRQVPMIAVVTGLEKFESQFEMDGWWYEELKDGSTNGTAVERMCFEEYYTFDAHVCITTLPLRDVDLLQSLRKRREYSEAQIRRLIQEQCRRPKRVPDQASGCCGCLIG